MLMYTNSMIQLRGMIQITKTVSMTAYEPPSHTVKYSYLDCKNEKKNGDQAILFHSLFFTSEDTSSKLYPVFVWPFLLYVHYSYN